MFDILVYIGRFQPVHNAHIEIIKKASALAREVVIIVGSAKQPRTYKNPWTVPQRHSMLGAALLEADIHNFSLEENVDSVYNDIAWTVRVQNIVAKYGDGKIGLIGHNKDDSTFYLQMFPQWEFVDVGLIQPLNATEIRDLYFRPKVNMDFIRGVVPPVVSKMLETGISTPTHEQIIREREFIETYKKQFAGLAYPPIFVTVDAVVFCAGNVLMVKRRSEPGRGLWALPGGFFNSDDKSIKDAMLRELKEETGIKVPLPVLAGSIEDNRVFDAIERSARGRTITHAFKINLADTTLPKVKGGDDAEKAKWVPIANLDPATCFEDHYEIITNFMGS